MYIYANGQDTLCHTCTAWIGWTALEAKRMCVGYVHITHGCVYARERV